MVEAMLESMPGTMLEGNLDREHKNVWGAQAATAGI
jgi:hypothetical protein